MPLYKTLALLNISETQISHAIEVEHFEKCLIKYKTLQRQRHHKIYILNITVIPEFCYQTLITLTMRKQCDYILFLRKSGNKLSSKFEEEICYYEYENKVIKYYNGETDFSNVIV